MKLYGVFSDCLSYNDLVAVADTEDKANLLKFIHSTWSRTCSVKVIDTDDYLCELEGYLSYKPFYSVTIYRDKAPVVYGPYINDDPVRPIDASFEDWSDESYFIVRYIPACCGEDAIKAAKDVVRKRIAKFSQDWRKYIDSTPGGDT